MQAKIHSRDLLALRYVRLLPLVPLVIIALGFVVVLPATFGASSPNCIIGGPEGGNYHCTTTTKSTSCYSQRLTPEGMTKTTVTTTKTIDCATTTTVRPTTTVTQTSTQETTSTSTVTSLTEVFSTGTVTQATTIPATTTTEVCLTQGPVSPNIVANPNLISTSTSHKHTTTVTVTKKTTDTTHVTVTSPVTTTVATSTTTTVPASTTVTETTTLPGTAQTTETLTVTAGTSTSCSSPVLPTPEFPAGALVGVLASLAAMGLFAVFFVRKTSVKTV